MSKILMYTNEKIYTTKRMTGGIRRFKMLYDGLMKKGYDVTLYCGESKSDLRKYNNNAHSVIREEKNTKLFASIGIFWKNRRIYRSLREEKYNDVIVFDVPTAVGLCLNRIKNIDLFLRQDIVEYRKIMLEEGNKGKMYTNLYLKLMSFCEYICCKNAKKIIVQCQYDLDNLLNRHRFISKKIKNKSYVQINNVNAPWIVDKSDQKIERVIDRSKAFNICFIGDFSNTRKGHDIFLSAIKKILDSKYEVNAYLIGDGKLLYKEKEKYSNYHTIYFLGRLDNPIDIIKQSDLVVVPSRADSCPNTVLESIYNGKLVIGSKAGGIPEILSKEEFLFDLDTDALAKKIVFIIDNKNKYSKMISIEASIKDRLSFDWAQKMIEIIGVKNDK